MSEHRPNSQTVAVPREFLHDLLSALADVQTDERGRLPALYCGIQAMLVAQSNGPDERVAQLTAHRACGNQEQDIGNGKLAGYCVVCQVPWPCAIAKPSSEAGADDAQDAARFRFLASPAADWQLSRAQVGAELIVSSEEWELDELRQAVDESMSRPDATEEGGK